MWIRSIAVRNWRGLDELALTGLSPGLNVIAGPNESGKSRLAEALQFALFESSSGQARFKRALASLGSSEVPQVTVEFDCQDQRWTVSKTFLRGQQTLLSSDSEQLQGEAAEQRLRELFGTQPGSAQSPATGGQLGRWALLWIQQGDSMQPPDVAGNSAAQGLLQEQLAAEAGVAAAGQTGQEVLALAAESRQRYFTASNDQPNAAYKRLREQYEAAVARCSELEREREALTADADRLETLRARARELTELLQQAETAHQKACDKAAQLQEVTDALERLQERSLHLDERSDRARETLADLDALLEQQQAVASTLQDLQQQVAAARAGADAAAREQQTLQQAVEDAEVALEQARAHRRELQRQQEAEQAKASLQEQERRLQQLTVLEDRIREQEQALAAAPAITQDQLQQLQQQDNRILETRARLEGAAARVTLKADSRLVVDGKPLAAGEQREFHITREQSIKIDALLTLEVRPGAGELQALHNELADLQSKRRELLQELDVADAAEATTAVERQQTLQQALKSSQQELVQHFPDGRAAFAAEISRLQGRLQQWSDLAAPPDDLESALNLAMQAEISAEQRLISARAGRDQQANTHHQAREASIQLHERLSTLQQQQKQVARQVEARPARATLSQQQVAAEQARARHQLEMEAANERYQAMGGAGVGEDLERTRRSVERMREQHRQTEHDMIGLEQVLQHKGNQDLHDALQLAQAEVAQAEAELARTDRAATTARLLHDVLQQEYHAEREALLEPLRRAIQGYLSELFPSVRPQLDDFQIQGLQPEGAAHVETLEQLSGGAREQVSMLTRLGLAEVLAGDEGWPLVLDDALVNTDAQRIQAMQRVLYRASRRQQVLLFTCHGRLYSTVGADQWFELEPRRVI